MLDFPDPRTSNETLQDTLSTLQLILRAQPSPGFETRLYVIFSLFALGFLLGLGSLIVTLVDYRRRKKRVWLWKLVQRGGGKYIVGNQHILFSILSMISCIIFIGATNNVRRTNVLRTFQNRAYFWRTLQYIPLLLHLWVSSWANLQASILGSQRATAQNILTPRLANGLYIGVAVLLLAITVTVGTFSAASWVKVWNQAGTLRAILTAGNSSLATLRNGQIDPAYRDEAIAAIVELEREASFFARTLTAVGSIYFIFALTLIAINVAGLSLLMTLRKQIKFNSRRYSNGIQSASRGQESNQVTSFPGVTVPAPAQLAASKEGEGMKEEPRRVLFARSASIMPDLAGDPLNPNVPDPTLNISQTASYSVSHLRQQAKNQSTGGAALREQAKQILALKKIEWDLLVYAIAIISLCALFAGVSLYLAVVTTSIYEHWHTLEISIFLVPWTYAIMVCAANGSLLFNGIRHLTRSTKGGANRTTVSGSPSAWTESTDLDDSVDEIATGEGAVARRASRISLGSRRRSSQPMGFSGVVVLTQVERIEEKAEPVSPSPAWKNSWKK